MLSNSHVEECSPDEEYGYGSGRAAMCRDESVLCAATGKCSHLFYDGYWNVCTAASTLQFVVADNTTAMTFIYGYLFPLLASLVVFSNGIVIFVISRQKKKASTTEPLLAMAVCASFGAIIPLPFTVWYYTLDHKNDLNQSIELCYLHKLCMELFPLFFNTLITLFTLILGGQRFIAVHYPLRCVHWCTRRTTRRSALVAVLIALAWTCVQGLAEFRVLYHICVQHTETSGVWAARCVLGHSQFVQDIGAELFVTVYDTSRILFLKLVPCVILFLLTIRLIRAIKSADSVEISMHRHRGSSSRASSTKTTVMLTVIIVMFLVAQLPSIIVTGCLKISDFLPVLSFSICENAHLYAISNIIIIGVHPITFAVYMLMSRRFRRTLRRLIGFRVLAKTEDVLLWSSTRANNSHGAIVNDRRESGLLRFR